MMNKVIHSGGVDEIPSDSETEYRDSSNKLVVDYPNGIRKVYNNGNVV